MLAVYVDDFKMSGPSANLKEAWIQIRKGIKVEDPTPTGKYLGCDHNIFEVYIKGGGSPVHDQVPKGTPNSVKVKVLAYSMREFFRSCFERYQELAGLKGKALPKVETPFLDESTYGVEEWEPDDSKQKFGTLKDIAARVLMKILHGARM